MDIKIPKFKKGLKKGSSVIDPAIYWEAVLFVALVLVVFSLTFGFFFFRKVNKEVTLPSDSAGGVASVREEKLSDILEYFNAREERSKEIVSSPAPIIDPSL